MKSKCLSFSQHPYTISASPEHIFQLPLSALCLPIPPTWNEPLLSSVNLLPTPVFEFHFFSDHHNLKLWFLPSSIEQWHVDRISLAISPGLPWSSCSTALFKCRLDICCLTVYSFSLRYILSPQLDCKFLEGQHYYFYFLYFSESPVVCS